MRLAPQEVCLGQCGRFVKKRTFVRLPVGFPCAEASGADCSLQAQHVADIREQLRSLLLDGAIWLEEASGTLAHAALRGVKNCGLVLFGAAKQYAVAVTWPASGTLDRRRPVAHARDFPSHLRHAHGRQRSQL